VTQPTRFKKDRLAPPPFGMMGVLRLACSKRPSSASNGERASSAPLSIGHVDRVQPGRTSPKVIRLSFLNRFTSEVCA
jgi:hypothetical protein